MNIKKEIENLIKKTLSQMFDPDRNHDDYTYTLEHPADLKHGDYSSNIAMTFFSFHRRDARKVTGSDNINISGHYNAGSFEWGSPRECAESIKDQILKNKPDFLENVTVAGAGFINFYLSREFFSNSIKEIIQAEEKWGSNEILKNKKVMVEYTQPNPFKPFHIGHLMSNAIGESISRIVQFSGAKVVRANYQGDVGPHVAKAIYGMHKAGAPADESANSSVLAQYIGECYSKGSDAYDNDGDAKKEIDEINKKVYDRSDEEINKIYDWGRKVTLEAFEEIYKTLGTKFDYYFFESIMAPIGEKIVRENVGKIFEESDGAIVFKAENYNPKLHTRVFINSKGLPTYETKEIGLTITKFEKENPDISIVTTAIEQAEYMKVVEQAIAIMHPEIQSRMKHITHGMMRLATGKMSSRKGNVVTGESLLRDSMDVVLEKIKDREFTEDEKKKLSEIVGVSALKYSILRSSLGSDIVYDFEKSISFEGDSGPYLQYSAIRAKSILAKALDHTSFSDIPDEVSDLEKVLYRFPEVVSYSYRELEPNHIATYLINLASSFNSFYAQTQILNTEDKYSHYYVGITKAFLSTMQNGLWLLGISLPERM